MVLAGDSAGGGLALAMALVLRDRGLAPRDPPGAARAVGRPHHLDARDARRLRRDRPVAVLQQAPGVRRCGGPGSPDDLGRPEVSPALADLAGLPQALMLYGTRDLLHPGCRLLARRAAEAGWDLTSIEEPDLIHVYPMLPFIPEARRRLRPGRGLPAMSVRSLTTGFDGLDAAHGVRRVAAAAAGLRHRAGLPLPRPRRARPRAGHPPRRAARGRHGGRDAPGARRRRPGADRARRRGAVGTRPGARGADDGRRRWPPAANARCGSTPRPG